MAKTVEKSNSSRRRPGRRSVRFILLEFSASMQRQFGAIPMVAHCATGEIREVLPSVSRDSVWISPSSETTDKLLRNLAVIRVPHHGRGSCIGGIFMLKPPRSEVLPILHGYFDRVIGEAPSFRFLPSEQLVEVLAAPQADTADLFIAGVVDVKSNTLALVRGNFERILVPLSLFAGAGQCQPDYRRFELDDYGHTVRFGEYEAAGDGILYEIDPEYRKRLRAKRRAEDLGFGPSLCRLRLQRGLSRDAFTGVSAKTIARLERSEVAKPQGRTLQIIAETLQVEPEEIETF